MCAQSRLRAHHKNIEIVPTAFIERKRRRHVLSVYVPVMCHRELSTQIRSKVELCRRRPEIANMLSVYVSVMCTLFDLRFDFALEV